MWGFMVPLFGWPNTKGSSTSNGVRTRLLHTYPRSYPIHLHVFIASSYPFPFYCYRHSTLLSRPLARSSQQLSSHLSPGHSFSPPSLLLSTLLRTYLIPARHVTFSSCFLPTSLPKKGLPLKETAVALVASILGGFGTVAMFCTLGVYV